MRKTKQRFFLNNGKKKPFIHEGLLDQHIVRSSEWSISCTAWKHCRIAPYRSLILNVPVFSHLLKFVCRIFTLWDVKCTFFCFRLAQQSPHHFKKSVTVIQHFYCVVSKKEKTETPLALWWFHAIKWRLSNWFNKTAIFDKIWFESPAFPLQASLSPIMCSKLLLCKTLLFKCMKGGEGAAVMWPSVMINGFDRFRNFILACFSRD